MEGLLLRLSAVDADAEAAVRVIAWFDALVERGASLNALVRATAALAECPAALVRPGEVDLRWGPDGRPVVQDAPSGEVALPGGGSVRLERGGPPGLFDELVLERFALSARLLGAVPAAPHLADPALVELVLSTREAEEDRSRALHLLGLRPGRPLRVAALEPGADLRALATEAGHAVRAAEVGGVVAALLQARGGTVAVDALRAALGGGPRGGLGGAVAALDAGTSWRQARLALRFADAPGELVDHDALGAPALLAEVPPAVLAAHPDVVALAALPALDLATLDAFCRTGSLRGAAAALHLHHSSVAGRLAHVQTAVGWTLDDPGGRFRARCALLAHRLARACRS
ncbi:helix-turn-helix domain-containing protein [Pseudonocardia sp. KRD-184]|uniref:Helix-turn-helix domain-containing protein n=1 Tax=Pseudonocardia oceani TaxID=2792013 RepID=A0ABS6U5A5_9PSEU|nr:helix-turn-helix domain-containing protein [Pseudonocardia oceani]MBW0092460.1 helix-turn-helix domain-containing protein [Pseudonocardia oceani]MBW0099390.1 helix-turn-helix domain-containing protein [Pseudonocardia oceani]MBW0125472.1 helix-turn-helix domain-containing protein [Pseudonocardia oceani]MBW0127168.1 helix-turn-helix domain-containing protein [Pseudonocardia oceani]